MFTQIALQNSEYYAMSSAEKHRCKMTEFENRHYQNYTRIYVI
jgi:hypothetical protein